MRIHELFHAFGRRRLEFDWNILSHYQIEPSYYFPRPEFWSFYGIWENFWSYQISFIRHCTATIINKWNKRPSTSNIGNPGWIPNIRVNQRKGFGWFFWIRRKKYMIFCKLAYSQYKLPIEMFWKRKRNIILRSWKEGWPSFKWWSQILDLS